MNTPHNPIPARSLYVLRPAAARPWAVYPDDGQDFETLMRSADDRMPCSKRDDPRRDASSGPDAAGASASDRSGRA